MDTALEVMRIILEYFGWDGNEIEELFYNRDRRFMNHRRSIVRRIGRELSRYQIKLFTKRSIVREIGSRLPLKPCKRPYFELSLNKNEQELGGETEGKPMSQLLMASLADVGWITDDDDNDDDVFTDPVPDEEEIIQNERKSPEKEIETITVCEQPAAAVQETTSSNEAMIKISALEDELQKLRAQIAMMIVAAPQSQETPSTPVGAPAPSPPPPPPPPPLTPMSTPLKPVSQIIRENRARRLSLAPGAGISEHSTGSSFPNMADVLKGLGKVKLRSVERSPGGTPLRKPPITTNGSDPASIIAQALKRKFAHRRSQEGYSPDTNKENNSPGSPFGTPPSGPNKSVPFGPHLLKATKKRRSGTGLNRTTKPSPLVEVC